MRVVLASDVTGSSDGSAIVAEALEELAVFDRHHIGFRLVEEHEERFQRTYGRFCHCHCAHSFGATDAERADHTEGSCSQGAATQVKILG